MPLYEFQCANGHVTEDLVPMGTSTIPCAACYKQLMSRHERGLFSEVEGEPVLASRILSPTRTTFLFADTKHKR